MRWVISSWPVEQFHNLIDFVLRKAPEDIGEVILEIDAACRQLARIEYMRALRHPAAGCPIKRHRFLL